MRVIEHRRHPMRLKPGDHLSQAGVDLARRVGATMGRYDLVVTSPVARAFETAIAMGFAVDEQWPVLFAPPEVADEVDWEKGCAEFARRPAGWRDGPVPERSGRGWPGARRLPRRRDRGGDRRLPAGQGLRRVGRLLRLLRGGAAQSGGRTVRIV